MFGRSRKSKVVKVKGALLPRVPLARVQSVESAASLRAGEFGWQFATPDTSESARTEPSKFDYFA